MKKKPKTLPYELHDPKLPTFGSDVQQLDLSDGPSPTPQNVLPQQTRPEDVLPGTPPQLW